MPTIVFDGPAPADFVSSDDHVSALVRRRAWMPKKTRRCARTLTSGAFPPHQVYDVHVSVGAATFAYTVTAFDALSMGVALCDAVDLNGFLGCPLLHQLPGRFNGKVFYKATCECLPHVLTHAVRSCTPAAREKSGVVHTTEHRTTSK
eukprot:m.1259684 g.1259684  ORF g.1259684 m.1259684 type:complete len:148 (-) comp24725_c0_seq41:122-565(-)